MSRRAKEAVDPGPPERVGSRLTFPAEKTMRSRQQSDVDMPVSESSSSPARASAIEQVLEDAYAEGYGNGMQSAWSEASAVAEHKHQLSVRLVAIVLRDHDERHPGPGRYCPRAQCRAAWEAERLLRE